MRTIRPFKRVMRSVSRNKVTVFTGVPSLYNILANAKKPWYKWILIRLFNPVRVYISGAAALPEKTLKNFEHKFRRPLLEGYGLTEASPVVSLNPLAARKLFDIGNKTKSGSVGVLLPSMEAKIVDEEGNYLAKEKVGELILKGPNIMRGYHNLKEETGKTLKNHWFYTGDLAKFDSRGYLYIMGRLKDMINVRGLNVYPKEIEEVLYRHSQVKEACVVGVYHRHRGEVPIAYIVRQGKVSERDFIKYMRYGLASYKIPLKVIFKESLPKNAAGKILKGILREEVKEIFKL